MKRLKKYLTSDIVKIIAIVLVGLIVATFLQNVTTTNNVSTEETLHENDSASLLTLNFENKTKIEKEQYEIDFTTQHTDNKEYDLQFNSYNNTDEDVLNKELFDIKKYNYIFVAFVVIIVSVVLFKTKEVKKGV